MALILFSIFLWSATGALGWLAYQRRDGSFRSGARDAVREAVFIAPRLLIGVLGAGFIAALLPGDLVSRVLGSESGFPGLLMASGAGLIIPGGPVVAFSVGAAALEAGAGSGQVIAFLTGWLLMSSNRTIIWETPIMGVPFTTLRYAISLPFPVVIGGIVTLMT
ncbi:permease [Roseibium sp. AS2]|uniref:permease n=1 Tax=Roseibium sp. AS2 TaxID=3135781 RepID=UPI0031819624